MRIIILSMIFIVELIFTIYIIVKAKGMKKKIARAFILFALLLLTGWILLFPHYELPEVTGKYNILTAEYHYIDMERKETYSKEDKQRALLVKFWFPDSEEKGPLVVFSHGSFGIKESNESLYRELASNGYTVCAIDHTYQCFSTIDPEGKKISIDKDFLKEVMNQDRSKKIESYEYFKKWMDIRTEDIDFVIDTIIQKNQNKENKMYTNINIEEIGLIGHSLGGSAVLGVGRKRQDIGCVISLEAPFLCDIIGAEEDKFIWDTSPYPIPVLNVYTDSSWDKLDEWEQYEKNNQLLKRPYNAEKAYSIYLKGAGHMTLTDLTLSCPLFCVVNGQNIFANGEEYIEVANNIYLKFFDAYLKHIGDFQTDQVIEIK